MKMVRFQTFWIQMQKNKLLDESRKTGQTSGTKMTFYSFLNRSVDPGLYSFLLFDKRENPLWKTHQYPAN
ncbi:hypothetical protein Hanom_Chr12g01115841 [Helianthus anomalus]